jgi:4'-phosphopantetheinyl transferase
MGASDVHVWIADPAQFQETREGELQALLDTQERERALAFRLEPDRRAYIVVHAMRRAMLARALHVAPEAIEFSHDGNGAPRLRGARDERIFFSHARRRKAVACAVTRAGPIGIDVETPPGEPDFSLLAPYMEIPDAAVRTQHFGPDLSAQFAGCWTALEAYWKARGLGLAAGNPRARLEPADRNRLRIRQDGGDVVSPMGLRYAETQLPATIAIAFADIEINSLTSGPSVEFRVRHCNSSMEISSSSAA